MGDKTFKVSFGPEDVRRFTVVPSSLQNFQQVLTDLSPDSFHPSRSSLSYQGTTGQISVSSEQEWQEFLAFSSVSPQVLKLSVLDKTSPVENRVKDALSHLFPSKQLLPTHVPYFLKSVVRFEKIDNQVYSLEVDLHQLTETLQREAMRLLDLNDSKSLNKAKDLFYSQIILHPQNSTTLYNLACVESLLGNSKGALDCLQRSIENGFDNLSHMSQDPDLSSIRGLEGWRKLVDTIKLTLNPPDLSIGPELFAKLQLLHEMGFCDDRILIPALKELNSVDDVLSRLLS